MECTKQLNIDLSKATREDQFLAFDLEDKFFKELDQDEIIGGHIHVEIKFREAAGDIFVFRFHISGKVIVECDRCLDDLALDVDVEDTIRVAYEDESESSADDIKIIPKNTTTYDASWDVYEIVELALPIQRTHDIGDCNEDMVERICFDKEDDDQFSE